MNELDQAKLTLTSTSDPARRKAAIDTIAQSNRERTQSPEYMQECEARYWIGKSQQQRKPKAWLRTKLAELEKKRGSVQQYLRDAFNNHFKLGS